MKMTRGILICISLLLSPLVLAETLLRQSSLNNLVIKEPLIKAELAQVNILDYITLVDQYLVAKGDTTPLPDPYSPEYGDSDYYTTYYGKVDPQGKRTTLNDWLDENLFNDYPHLVYSAEYINSSDLGFGRKMHCLDNGRSSCYVQNYLDPEGSSDFAATVTMERMNNNFGTFVAFFVYDAAGNRINQIALDSEGPKSVPESCYACHSGYRHGSSSYGGNYLPFDIENLKDWPGHPTRNAQLEDFRKLNLLMHKDAYFYSSNDSMLSLIEGWYDGTPNSGQYYDANRLPESDWYTNPNGDNYSTTSSTYKKHQVEKKLYKDVYSDYCRLCHVAQDLDWQLAHAGDFARAAYNHICVNGNNKPRMPHAELTDKLFRNDRSHFPPAKSTVSSSLIRFDNQRLSTIQDIKIVQAAHVSINDSIIAAIGHTGYEMLCEELPIVFPAANQSQGETQFNNECSGCHYVDSYLPNKIGGDISCKGAWLRQDMGSINGAMNSVQLDYQEMQNLDRYINSFPDCQ